ncbi:polyprenol phosphomannose-dependent alpha 1,6 mannosyltransferase MptB [Streptomyces aidingensis]|uniref:Alpha-1,6-mannosyltransferase n=1 Tax=Streptomyces aidingensis TaxID=910347 RepID=A0A1I1UA17_9ACTN|nr:polyprenol phosphomannose-dependent alpha 1,6 mannosyltransferase MptB [Streptomyces aidingensis]SFD67534.1 alpha-1,6-mannosyltransferase [Streptomyces aidingensis]
MRRCRLVGLAGTAALAAGGSSAGALSVQRVMELPAGRAAAGLAATYFGLVLLVAAWARLGRTVRGTDPPAPGRLLATLALWAAPLLLAPPLFSRDVYSYLAQGAMADARLDVYTQGPADLGGPLAAEVAPAWQHTPTPYGPVFLSFASVINDLARAEVWAGVLGMRLLALLGVALMVLSLPPLARACGTDPGRALWLGALNPLVLLHLVGGAHNDAVMLGLLGTGLVAALGRRRFLAPVLATVLVTLAALVKVPAALGLLAVVSLRARRPAGRARWWRAGAAVTGTALVTTVLATAVTGHGYGWIGALRTPVSPDNWAPVSVLGRITQGALRAAGSGLAHFAQPAWQLLGLAVLCAAVLVLWLRRPASAPLYALGLSLTALAVLGPAIRPWYVLWGVFLVAAAAPGGAARSGLAAASGVLAFAVLPSGFAPDGGQVALAVCGGLCALPALWWARRLGAAPSVLPPLPPPRPGPGPG